MAVAGVFSAGGVRIERGEYGVPDVVDCNHQIHLVSESFVEQSAIRSIRTSGDLELRLAYGGGGLQHLLAALLFSHPDKSPLDLGGGLYLHYFELERGGNSRVATVWDSSSPSGKRINKRATVLIQRTDTVAEIVSFQPKNLSFDITESPRLTTNGDATRLNTNPEYSGSGLCFSYVPVGLVSIIHADVRIYPLHKWNFSSDTSLTVTEDGAPSAVTVIIPAGEYMAVQLAREIEKQLNASPDLAGRYFVLWEGDILRFVIRSNVKFSIDSSGIAYYLGFPTGSPSAHVHRSPLPAVHGVVDTTGISLGVADMSIVVDGGLRRQREIGSAWEIGEARTAKPPTVRVTLNLHRPHFWDVGELAGEYFAIRATFTHPDGVGKMEFVVNHARITSPEAPVTGEQQIRERIPFEGEYTEFHTFKLFFDERFMIRDLPASPSGGNTTTVGVYDRRLFAGDELGTFMRLDDSGWSTITTLGDPVSAMATWRERLYLGTEVGDIYVYDGNTISSVGSTAGYVVAAMVPYGGKLYILLSNGAIYTYDGTTITQDTTAPTATVGWDLLATNGKLYALLRVTNETVYEYDGSTWAQVYSFPSTKNTGSLVRLGLRKRIAAIAGNSGAYYDIGGSGGWSSYPVNFSEDMKHGVAHGSELLMVSTSGKLYWYDQTGFADNQLGTLGTTPHYKPVEFENRIVVPVNANLRYAQIPYIFHMTLQDKTTFNPYI